MGKENGQAAPKSSTAHDTTSGPANAEPSDAELKDILFAGGSTKKPRVSKAPVQDTDDDNEPLDQDDAAENDDADLDEEHDGDESGDEGSNTSRRKQQDASDADDENADADAEDAQNSDDDQGEDGEQNAADDQDPDEALDDEIAEARAEFTPAQQKIFDRALRKKTQRVIKLRTELEAATQRATDAEAALEEARTSAPAASVAPTADDPLADVGDEQTLDKRLQEARKLRRWCLANRDGGVIKDGDKEIEVSREKASELLADAEEIIEEHAPKKRQFLQHRAQFDQVAVSAYPWLKNSASPAARAVEQTLKRYPGLRTLFPGAKLAVADMLMGAHLRQQQAAKSSKGGGTQNSKLQTQNPRGAEPPRAPATPAGGARPPRVNGAAKAHGDAQRKLEQTGDDPDNAALRGIIARRG